MRAGGKNKKHPHSCDRERPSAFKGGRGGRRTSGGPRDRPCLRFIPVCFFHFSFSIPTAFMTVSAAAFPSGLTGRPCSGRGGGGERVPEHAGAAPRKRFPAERWVGRRPRAPPACQGSVAGVGEEPGARRHPLLPHAVPPEFVIPLSEVTCETGETVVLRCRVCGRPKASITWKGPEHNTLSNDGHYSISYR